MNFSEYVKKPPFLLYHATYGAYLASIKQKGLIPRYHCVWKDCQYGIYLASDEEEAISYPETTDNPDIPDEYLDDIIVFEIKTSDLNLSKLSPDPHVIWGENPLDYSTWIYRDSIPYVKLRLLQ